MPQLIIERDDLAICMRDCQAVSRVIFNATPNVDASMRGAFIESRKKMDRVRAFLKLLDEQVDEGKHIDDTAAKGPNQGRIIVADRPKFTAADLEGFGE